MSEVNKMVVATDMVVFNRSPIPDTLGNYPIHVLLIKRQDNGKYALPGGVVENETALQASIRECLEETGLSLKDRSFTLLGIWDEPDRDSRGRTVSVAFATTLHNIILPEIKAGDDAKECFWQDVRDLNFINKDDSWAFPDHKEMISIGFAMRFDR